VSAVCGGLVATNHTRGYSVRATQRETMYRLGALIRAIAVTAFTGAALAHDEIIGEPAWVPSATDFDERDANQAE
jgi:hypothetical protein